MTQSMGNLASACPSARDLAGRTGSNRGKAMKLPKSGRGAIKALIRKIRDGRPSMKQW